MGGGGGGGKSFYIGLYRENVKIFKPQGLEPWYLVCSII